MPGRSWLRVRLASTPDWRIQPGPPRTGACWSRSPSKSSSTTSSGATTPASRCGEVGSRALAGLTLALQNGRLVAMTGLITGTAAGLSMAASEYLSVRAQGEHRNPTRAAVYTGIAYIITVVILIAPHLALREVHVSLALTLGAAVLIIASFTMWPWPGMHHSGAGSSKWPRSAWGWRRSALGLGSCCAACLGSRCEPGLETGLGRKERRRMHRGGLARSIP